MKIAFVVMRFPVLSETFILNQVTGLIDRGHEVDIFCSMPRGDGKMHPDVEKYGLLERTRCIGVPVSIPERVLKGAGLFFGNFLRNPGLILDSLNVFRHGRRAASLRNLYLAARFAGGYDIVHCHYGFLGEKGTALRRMGAEIGGVITSFHGFDITNHVERHGRNVYRDLFAEGDLFLPISDNWHRRLIELGCPENKIRVQRMGIDCARFAFEPRTVEEGEPLRVISVARLVEKKGLEYGIRAVSRAIREGCSISYTIVGDGTLRDELEGLIRRLGTEDGIRLVGWKPQNEVCALMSSSHVLLAPSTTAADGDQEGIPVVLMEAMAMGLPVISTRHSGIPELVEDEVSGFLASERDEEAIYDLMLFVQSHPERCREIVVEGRKQVEDNFNMEKQITDLEEIYREALRQRS